MNRARALALTVAAPLGCAPSPSDPPPTAPHAVEATTTEPQRGVAEADVARMQVCVDGASTLHVIRGATRETTPLSASGCTEFESAAGRLVHFQASAGERNVVSSVVSTPGSLQLELVIPPEPGVVPGRVTSAGPPATVSELVTAYWFQDRSTALQGGPAADALATRMWARADGATRPVREVAHVIWLISRIAQRERSITEHERVAAAEVIGGLAADSPAWAIDAEAILLAHQAGLVSTTQLDRVFDAHGDEGVRGAAAYALAEDAFERRDPERVRQLLTSLEGNETALAQATRTFDPDGTLVPDQPLPPFEYQTLEGATKHSDGLRGRATVLYVWASWCGGCREQLARLRTMHPSLVSKGAQLLTLSLDEDRRDAAAVLLHPSPMPGEHGWIPSAAARAIRKRLELWSASKLLLVDASGVVVLEDPSLESLASALAKLRKPARRTGG